MKPSVILLVCGRFHYHKYLHLLAEKQLLKRFIYSYKMDYDFGVDRRYLKNLPIKEYAMYAGARLLKGKLFYKYLTMLHNIWQWQAKRLKPEGNIVHFLIHGNCSQIIQQYKAEGITVIGEVVNAHPAVQEQLLTKEYAMHQRSYEYGEKLFKEKIVQEYMLCDYLLVPSAFIKQSLVAYGIESSKIKVLPYGLDLAERTKDTLPIQRKAVIQLLYVGQISFRKGVIYLLKALPLLRQKGIHFHLTLVGHIDKEYKQVIQPYLTDKNITHITHVVNSEIYELMRQQDLFVMPSIEDGFGVVVAEALSVHLPVIVTSNCGASEIVTNGENGFVIDAFSEMAICNTIVQSINYCFCFKQEPASWKEYVAQLEQFYVEVLN